MPTDIARPRTVLMLCSYFEKGAQILTPMDNDIAQSIEENLIPWPGAWNALQWGEYVRPQAYQSVVQDYFDGITRLCVSGHSFSLLGAALLM